MAKITHFFRETKGEMRQVKWPKRRHLILYTVVVVLFSLILGYVLGAFDSLFQLALRAILLK